MLKRCQILLTDWQLDFAKKVSERDDFSISEVVRLFFSMGVLYATPEVYSNLRKSINFKRVRALNKEGGSIKTSDARRHQLLSDMYFETRKFIEKLMVEIDKEEKPIKPKRLN